MQAAASGASHTMVPLALQGHLRTVDANRAQLAHVERNLDHLAGMATDGDRVGPGSPE
jgi:hypothetical protein